MGDFSLLNIFVNYNLMEIGLNQLYFKVILGLAMMLDLPRSQQFNNSIKLKYNSYLHDVLVNFVQQLM